MRRISKDEREAIERFLNRVDEAADHYRHLSDDDMADNLYFGSGMVRNLLNIKHKRPSEDKDMRRLLDRGNSEQL